MLQLHSELQEAALTSGAGRLRVLRRITGPLVWPALAAVWIWVLAHALREPSSAIEAVSFSGKLVEYTVRTEKVKRGRRTALCAWRP